MYKSLLHAFFATLIFLTVHLLALSVGLLKPWVSVSDLVYPTAIAFIVSFVAAAYLRWVIKLDHPAK